MKPAPPLRRSEPRGQARAGVVGLWIGCLAGLACRGEDECQPPAEPCGDRPGTYLVCEEYESHVPTFGTPGNSWSEWDCEGIDPICRPVGADGHVCEDKAMLDVCASEPIVIEHTLPPGSDEAQWVDVDGDGASDLLFLCSESGGPKRCGLWSSPREPGGAFGDPQQVGTYQGTGYALFSVSDFDGDRQPDIIVQWEQAPSEGDPASTSSPRSTLQLWMGRAGGFERGAELVVDAGRHVTGTYDLDADRASEIVLQGADDMAILSLDGDRLVERQHFALDWYVTPTDSLRQAADFDGNQRPYLIVGEHVLRPDTKGRYALVPDLRIARDAVLGDFDGDGSTDLVTMDWTVRPTIQVSTSNRDGSFTPRGSRVAPYRGSMFAGDVDGDGRADIVVVHGEDVLGLSVFRGLGKGDIAAPKIYSVEADLGYPVVLADTDADKAVDLVGTRFDRTTGAFALTTIPRACQ